MMRRPIESSAGTPSGWPVPVTQAFRSRPPGGPRPPLAPGEWLSASGWPSEFGGLDCQWWPQRSELIVVQRGPMAFRAVHVGPRTQRPRKDPLSCVAYPENVGRGKRNGTVFVMCQIREGT